MIRWAWLLFICCALCSTPIQIVEDLILDYDRPITVCHLTGSMNQEFLELSERYPHVVFIGQKSPVVELTQDNVIGVAEAFTIDNINQLAHFEHFDIAYSFADFQKQPNKYQWIKALLRLSDNIVLEIPTELHGLMESFCQKIDAIVLKRLKDDVYILAKRQLPKYFDEQWLQINDIPKPLMTSHHYAIIESHGNVIRLDPGLSLYGFKMLRGIYPSAASLIQMLREYQWRPDSACLPWNIILGGNRITWRKRFEEPPTWSKEGLDSCIGGLNISEPKEYTRYTIHECKRLKLN